MKISGNKGWQGVTWPFSGNSRTPYISRQRLKLETWNLARRITARCSVVKNENVGQKRSLGGHVTILGNFWTPSIYRQRLKLETWNLACRMIAGCPIVKNENLDERGSPGVLVTMQNNREVPYSKKWTFASKGVARVMWPFLGILGPPPYLGNGWS